MEDEKKFLQTVLKYKNEQHNSSEYDQIDDITPQELQKYYSYIPEFDKHILEQGLKDFKNTKQLLKDIQFKYNYNDQILSQLLLIHIGKPSDMFFKKPYEKVYEKLVILICFQLISYIYITKSQNEEKDFKLFIQLMNNYSKAEPKTDALINLSFKILMKYSLQNHKPIWSNDNAVYVIMFFKNNESLSSDFYQIFIDFSKQIIDDDNNSNFDFRRNIIMLIEKFLSEEKREILKKVIEKQKFKDILEINRQLLTKFDRTALHVIALLSTKIKSQPKSNNNFISTSPFEQELKMIPPLFTAKANQIKMNVNLQTKKIHDIPSSINQIIDIQKQKEKKSSKFEPELNQQSIKLRISSSSVLFVDEDNFCGKLNMPSSELCIKPYYLFNIMNQELKDLAQSFTFFINELNPKYVKNIFNETMNVFSLCNSADSYGAFAAFLWTLKNINAHELMCSNYLAALFNDLLFNPDHTVFGPYLLDPMINLFRSVFVDMICDNCPALLHDHLKYFQNQPFLFTEIIGRYYYKIQVKLLLSDEAFEMISQVNNILRFLKAPSNARSTILSFIFLYLENPETSIDCLSSQAFIDHFFKIIFEKSLGEMFLLSVLSQSFAYLEIDYSDSLELNGSFVSNLSPIRIVNHNSLIPLRDFLYHSAKSYDQIDQIIFTFVSNVCRLRPKFIRFFRPFLELMIEKSATSPSQKSTKNAISYLTSLLSFYSEDDTFILDPYYYRILISNIEFISYTDILNLICESTSITTKSNLLMKRPIFLPLLFIKYSKDINQIYRIIKHLLDLADLSQNNRRALHEGKIDLILLHIIVHDPLININGYMFDMSEIIKNMSKNATRMIIKLIKLICLAKSNGEVAQYFTKVVTGLNGENEGQISDSKFELMNLTMDILGSILLDLSSQPKNRYEIGNISEICTIEDLHSSVLDKDFTFFFSLKIDQLFFKYSTSVIELITFSNRADQVFSICLINGILCAKYIRNDLQTKVLLCPRLVFNQWENYTIIFKKIKSNENNNKLEYAINTYRNLERLHDSDFCDIKFEYGPINVKIGGYTEKVKGEKIKSFNKLCGFISSIRLYSRTISKDEIRECISHSNTAPNDYFFSTLSECNFPSQEDVKLKRNYKILIQNKKLSLKFSKDYYDIEMLDECIGRYEQCFIKSLIHDYITKTAKNLNIEYQKIISHNYLSKIISLLRYVLSRSTNKHLSADFASILFNNPDSISFSIFNVIVQVVQSIENIKTRFYWLEDVVFNFALWEKSRNNFSYILREISNNLLQYKSFLYSKSYFSYFLIFFNKHINDSNIIDAFTDFLARLSSMHLTYQDCDILFSYYSNSTNKFAYIKLIFLICISKEKSNPFLELMFPAGDRLLSILKEENNSKADLKSDQLIQIIVYTILSLNCLYKNSFHSRIPQIMRLLYVDLKKLFEELEKFISEYPNIFSLTTAIAFKLELENISVVPDFMKSILPTFKSMKSKKEYDFLWFIYPLLYSILPTTKENSRSLIFEFIATDAVYTSIITGIDVINDVVSFLTLISFEIKHYSTNDFDPVCLILIKMLLITIDIPDKNKFYLRLIFSLFQSSIMALFFNLNGKNIGDEIINSNVFPEFSELRSSFLSKKNKFSLSPSLESLSDLFQKVLIEKFTFCYHLDIDIENKTITYRFLLDKVISLLELLVGYNFEIANVPIKDSGIFSTTLEFTIQDLPLVFKHFQREHICIQKYETFEKMNSIFYFFNEKISIDFDRCVQKIVTLINGSFEYKKVLEFDHNKMTDFEHKELIRIADLFNLTIDEDKSKLIRDPTLNDRYTSHLMKRKKNSNRNVIRFPEDLPFDKNSGVVESVKLISFNGIISAFLKVKDTEISLTNFSNRPDHFKRIPFSMITKVIYINKKTVLILTQDIFNKTYLIEFNQSNKNFFDSLQKAKYKKRNVSRTTSSPISSLSPSNNNYNSNFVFRIFPTESDVIEQFSNITNRFYLENNKITAFHYLILMNLMAGRTCISNQSEYPIFPSPEMLKNTSSFNEVDEETQKKIIRFAKPEEYFFFDDEKSDNLMQIYENAKLLESKSSQNVIKKFIRSNFPGIIKQKEKIRNDNTNMNVSLSRERQQTETELDSLESSSSSYLDNNNNNLNRLHQSSSPIRSSVQELEIKVHKLSRTNSKPEIIYASALNLKNKHFDPFCIVYSNGLVAFICVTFDSEGNAKCDERGSSTKMAEKNIDSYHFSPINDGIIVYDGRSMLTITPDGFDEMTKVFFEQQLFNYSIFMRTPSIVSQSIELNFDQSYIKPPIKSYFSSSYQSSFYSDTTRNKSYLKNVRDICFVSHKVLCMAMNENKKVFALGCDDCKVRIRNLINGKKIRTVSLLSKSSTTAAAAAADKEDDGIPRKILITNRWGFIVVNTLYKLFIFSTNGSLIQCMDDFPKITQWFSFYSTDGFDFVGFESEEKPYCIFYFEALKPFERKFKMVPSNHSQSKIVAINYDITWNSFVILASNGKIHILPFN